MTTNKPFVRRVSLVLVAVAATLGVFAGPASASVERHEAVAFTEDRAADDCQVYAYDRAPIWHHGFQGNTDPQFIIGYTEPGMAFHPEKYSSPWYLGTTGPGQYGWVHEVDLVFPCDNS